MIRWVAIHWAVLAALAASASPVTAQTWTVLPVERDARVPEVQRQAAGRAVADAPALGPGARVLSAAQVRSRLGGSGREALASCVEVDCARNVALAADLDFVAVVAVWPGNDGGGEAATVAVSLVGGDGSTYEADSPVQDGDVEQAATAALVAATRRRGMGGGVELRVSSSPPGALVVVDGTEVGVTPYLGNHPAGSHEVEVRLRGVVQRRTVELEREPVQVEVALDVGDGSAGHGGGAGGAGEVGGDGDGGAVVGPLVLGLAGVASLGVAAYGVLSAGGCERRAPSGTCLAEEGANVPVVVTYAAGGVVAIAGALLWRVLSAGSGEGGAEAGREHVVASLGAGGGPGLGLRLGLAGVF